MRIEGLSEVRDALASLPNATQKTIMRKILVKRGEPIRQAAKSLAPNDSGFLAESIKIQQRTGGGAGKKAFAAVLASGGSRSTASAAARSANSAGKSSVEIFIGPNSGPREIAAEFGTKHRPPQPFLRPAWDAGKASLLDGVAADMWAEIKKAVDRRAKKAAKIAAGG